MHFPFLSIRETPERDYAFCGISWNSKGIQKGMRLLLGGISTLLLNLGAQLFLMNFKRPGLNLNGLWHQQF